MAQQLSPAAIAAALRYKPQHEALAEAAMAAKERFLSEVQAGKSQGLVAQQAAQRAKPAVEGVYNEAAKESGRSRNLLAPALEKLAADSPFKAAAANEAAAGAERLQGERAHAVSDVHQRGVAASQLPAFATQAAGQALAKELGTLKNKESGVLGSEALATGVQEGSERKDAAKEAAAERRETRKEEAARRLHGEPTWKDLHPNGAGSSGKEFYKPSEVTKARAHVAEVRELAANLYAKGLTRAQVLSELSKGSVPVSHSVTVKNKETGKSETKSIKTEGRKPIPPEVLVAAALDWAEYGHISASTLKRLEGAKYNAKTLGLPVEPKPKTPGEGVARGGKKYGGL